jgi:hypothetical protein
MELRKPFDLPLKERRSGECELATTALEMESRADWI